MQMKFPKFLSFFQLLQNIQSNLIQVSMTTQRLTLVRLQKQQKGLEKQPVPNMIVTRKGVLNFHFCIHGLDGPYAGGFYHGVLELAADYPFSPPQLKFFTQSGRFETNKPICTTFTNYHKEQWSSAWNVRTMLLGVISFMTGNQGGNGSINSSFSAKHSYASKSLKRNLQSEQFRQLFQDKLFKLNLINASPVIPQNQVASSEEVVPASNQLYALFLALIIVIVLYGMIKNTDGNGNEQL